MTKILLGLFSGIAFGFVIQRVGATNAEKLAKAHLMIESVIPKFMLATVALCSVGLLGLTAVGVGRTLVIPTSIVATGLGAVIFGIGWGLAGYCPGTTWAAVGEGRMDAVFAMLGGFAGAAFFAHFHETLIPALYNPTYVGGITLADWVGGRPIAVVLLVVLFSVCILAIGKLWGRNKEASGET
jgi:hypothetical protein